MPNCSFLKKILISIFTSGLLLSSSLSAGAFSAEATVEVNPIAVGEIVRLSITVAGAKPTNPPESPQIEGLQIRSLGTSQQFQFINGQASSTITYTYSVLAIKPGEYTLGPYKLITKREEAFTNAVNLTVTTDSDASSGANRDDKESAPESGDSLTSDRASSTDPIFLEVDLPKTRIYLGEKIPVTISLFLRDLLVRDISYPVLNQSELLFTRTGQPVEKRKSINGLSYQVVEFPATLTAVKTGKFTLGPAELECAVLARRQTSDPFSDFFGDFLQDYEKRPLTLKSNTWELEVLPLPQAKQPVDFTGGVGQFNLEVSASPLEVQVGDPITVTLTVTGDGNLSALSPPRLTVPEGFKVYEAQRKALAEESASSDQVVFEQVLIPLDQESDRIGPYQFSYFDPEAAIYKSLRSAALKLTVKPNPDFASAMGPITSSRQEPLYGRDLVFIKETPGRLRRKEDLFYRKAWFWWVQMIPLLALFLAIYYRKRTAMLSSTTPKARYIRATAQANQRLKKIEALLTKGDREELLDELHSTVREYLGERFNLPAAGMTGEVVTRLKTESFSEEELQEIADFFQLYDFHRFTGKSLGAAESEKLYALATRIITAAR